MSVLPVEWVLVIFYGSSAHRATYGRLDNGKYTKDYIQLSRKTDFIRDVAAALDLPAEEFSSTPLLYRWPGGNARGYIEWSADRPHLKWVTSKGAPDAWRMALNPTEAGPETIPGDPDRSDFDGAEKQLANLTDIGAGQPYLIAVKLKGEDKTLHLRAYLKDPAPKFEFARLGLLPRNLKSLASGIGPNSSSALTWSTFDSGGVYPEGNVVKALAEIDPGDIQSWVAEADEDLLRALLFYLMNPGRGLFLDPTRNHDCWIEAPNPGFAGGELGQKLVKAIRARGVIREGLDSTVGFSDAGAEYIDVSVDEVDPYSKKIDEKDYGVDDEHGSTKIRGAAQRAFARTVKANYGGQCAITGLSKREYLVASHIVPWSQDQSIRLDPSNGICLSLIVDKAFEVGHLLIDDDFLVRVQFSKIADDDVLHSMLEPYDGLEIAFQRTIRQTRIT